MQLCSCESGAATVDVKSDLLTDMLFFFNIDVRKKYSANFTYLVKFNVFSFQVTAKWYQFYFIFF